MKKIFLLFVISGLLISTPTYALRDLSKLNVKILPSTWETCGGIACYMDNTIYLPAYATGYWQAFLFYHELGHFLTENDPLYYFKGDKEAAANAFANVMFDYPVSKQTRRAILWIIINNK